MQREHTELEASTSTEMNIAEEAPEQRSSWVRELIETLLLAGIVWAAFTITTARFVVEGNSMEPNIHTGEFILVTKTSYWFSEPKRGDIIVFHFPGNPNDDFIKRIIGLPGDSIALRSGQFFINGVPLQESFETYPTPSSGFWTVGEDEYFVVGDNRSNSSDSRTWRSPGLDKDLIIGKAWVIYWPPGEWNLVPHQVLAGQ